MTDIFSQIYGRRNPYFEHVLKEGTNTSPIRHWSQGASRLAFALLAGLERNEQAQRDREGMATWMMQKQGQPFQPTRRAPPVPAPSMAGPPAPGANVPAGGANAPAPQPFQMPLMTGPSGQPIPPSGFIGDNVNLFDPSRLNPWGGTFGPR